MSNYVYRDLPIYEEGITPIDINELQISMNKFLESKSQSFVFLTHQNVRIMQNFIHLLKKSQSHFLFISDKKSGSRSMIKMVAHLKNLTYI